MALESVTMAPMSVTKTLVLSLIALAPVAAPALAAGGDPPRAASVSELEVRAPPKSKSVSELDVNGRERCEAPRLTPRGAWPKVISSFPANGAVIRPGVLVLRVTFNVPMSCSGFFTAWASLPSPCPEDQQHWVLTFDRRTIRAICHVDAASQYGVQMSDQPESRFFSVEGQPLSRYAFSFTTSDEAMVQTISESLDQDPLANPPRSSAPMPVNDVRSGDRSPSR
jgi:hypothetical protein